MLQRTASSGRFSPPMSRLYLHRESATLRADFSEEGIQMKKTAVGAFLRSSAGGDAGASRSGGGADASCLSLRLSGWDNPAQCAHHAGAAGLCTCAAGGRTAAGADARDVFLMCRATIGPARRFVSLQAWGCCRLERAAGFCRQPRSAGESCAVCWIRWQARRRAAKRSRR